ncbi:cysteine and glycine-rich protein 1-like isoform X2 [Ischnura elegans]|uniref:cysteine and glycine-rich protein 1-like isoform X2 n=1 Tax=Ischnura elegans TaxID=197161 RepID=UPI001ED8B20D|nr:cysteine and glycine-rich protein 1-like isoform X2 [Ischnura elegans]
MSEICPKCQRKVYPVEEKRVFGKAWHVFCFSCRICKKLLEDENDAIRKDDEVYCLDCFERHDELEAGSGGEETEKTAKGSQISLARTMCSHPHTLATPKLPLAITTFYARLNHRRTASKEHHGADDGEGYFGKPFPLFSSYGEATPLPGTPQICNRCGKKVFHAEARQVDGRLYHDCCFSCLCCCKPLNITSVNVSRGSIYCKSECAFFA